MIRFILIFLANLLCVRASGCDFDPNSHIFIQEEKTEHPIENWGWTWTKDIEVVPNKVGWPSYKYMPDGHISTVKVIFIFSINSRTYNAYLIISDTYNIII